MEKPKPKPKEYVNMTGLAPMFKSILDFQYRENQPVVAESNEKEQKAEKLEEKKMGKEAIDEDK